jgi:hypothetical protein
VKSASSDGWTAHTELLVQLIEEVSILAADKRRDEPRTIPRPYKKDEAALASVAPQRVQPEPPKMTGHHAMLAAAASRGMVQVSG